MNKYYFNSSALLKYYIQETGALWVEQIIDSETPNIIFTSLITMAEIASALAVKNRATHNNISDLECQQLLKRFVMDSRSKFTLLPVRRPIVNRAMSLSKNHRLRGYDSVQLGTAVIMKQVLAKYTTGGELIFVASDKDLLLAAQAEGIQTEDPMTH